MHSIDHFHDGILYFRKQYQKLTSHLKKKVYMIKWSFMQNMKKKSIQNWWHYGTDMRNRRCMDRRAGPILHTVYPKKYAHGFCFAVHCCGYTLTDFPISIRLTSQALWQSNDCPSASKATLMNMNKYFMWIHYERLHNHNKAKHNKTVCIFLGIYCTTHPQLPCRGYNDI